MQALTGDVPKGSAQAVLDETTIVLPLDGLIDIAAEHARLAKDRDKLIAEAKKMRQKLDNPEFVSRAKEEVVAENRERLAGFELEIARLQAALDRLERPQDFSTSWPGCHVRFQEPGRKILIRILLAPVECSDAGMRGGGRALSDG